MKEKYGFVSRKYELTEAATLQAETLESFDEGSPCDHRGISFFGISGCGKSALRRKIGAEAERLGDFYVIHYDFDDSVDPMVFLAQLARSLSQFGCSCSNFCALFSKLANNQPQYSIYLPIETRGKAAASILLKALASRAKLPLEAPKAARIYLSKVDETCNLIADESSPSAMELSQALAFDLERWIRTGCEKPTLILLDTYERITCTEKSELYATERDCWLEPLFGIVGICWMVFGRAPIRESFGFKAIELSIFGYRDVRAMLGNAGIHDKPLTEAVCTASRGLPLYVAVFVDTFFLAQQAGRMVTVDEALTAESLIESFLKYFNESNTTSVETLCDCACVERWNIDILMTVDPEVANRTSTVQSILDLSFVFVREDESASMHEVAARAIRNQSSLRFKRAAVDEALGRGAKSIEGEMEASGWKSYSWWESAIWACRLWRQYVNLAEEGRLEAPQVESRQVSYATALSRIGLNKEAFLLPQKSSWTFRLRKAEWQSETTTLHSDYFAA